jgi:hypothetical protein
MFPNDSQWTQVLSESERGYAAIMALQRPFSWDDHTDAMPQQQESLKAKAMGSTDEWKGSKIGQSGNKSRKRTSQIKA